jgi:hypothetical protein
VASKAMPSFVGLSNLHVPTGVARSVLPQQRQRILELDAERLDDIADRSGVGVVAMPVMMRLSSSTLLTSRTA